VEERITKMTNTSNDRVDEISRQPKDQAESSTAELQRDAERLRLEDQKPAAATGQKISDAVQPTSGTLDVSDPYPGGFDPNAYAEGIFSNFRRPHPQRPQPNRQPEQTQPESKPSIDATVQSDVVAAKPNFKIDGEGKVIASYPDGDMRTMTMVEGSNAVQSLSYLNKTQNRTFEYTRLAPADGKPSADGLDDFQYSMKDANGKVLHQGVWHGSLEWRDGVFAYKDGNLSSRRLHLPRANQRRWFQTGLQREVGTGQLDAA
jgi:hypothetical protein